MPHAACPHRVPRPFRAPRRRSDRLPPRGRAVDPARACAARRPPARACLRSAVAWRTPYPPCGAASSAACATGPTRSASPTPRRRGRRAPSTRTTRCCSTPRRRTRGRRCARAGSRVVPRRRRRRSRARSRRSRSTCPTSSRPSGTRAPSGGPARSSSPPTRGRRGVGVARARGGAPPAWFLTNPSAVGDGARAFPARARREPGLVERPPRCSRAAAARAPTPRARSCSSAAAACICGASAWPRSPRCARTTRVRPAPERTVAAVAGRAPPRAPATPQRGARRATSSATGAAPTRRAPTARPRPRPRRRRAAPSRPSRRRGYRAARGVRAAALRVRVCVLAARTRLEQLPRLGARGAVPVLDHHPRSGAVRRPPRRVGAQLVGRHAGVPRRRRARVRAAAGRARRGPGRARLAAAHAPRGACARRAVARPRSAGGVVAVQAGRFLTRAAATPAPGVVPPRARSGRRPRARGGRSPRGGASRARTRARRASAARARPPSTARTRGAPCGRRT